MTTPHPKQLYWVSSAKRDLLRMPEEVVDVMGYALHLAQEGKKHFQAKPLKGHGSAGVLEVVEDDDGNTYRGVYTVEFQNAVYVLHCFQKKSRRGVATPKQDLDLVLKRLQAARQHAQGGSR